MTEASLLDTLRVLGWSRGELADRLKVHRNAVGKWISGRSPVPGYVEAYLGLVMRLREIEARAKV